MIIYNIQYTIYNFKLTINMKKILSLLAVALMAAGVMASETYTFSSFESAKDVTLTATDFTIVMHKNTGSTNPAWNANSNEARLYAAGSMVITSEKTITKIEYNYQVNASNKGIKPTVSGAAGTTDAGTWSEETKTWTGSDKEITLSTTGSAGNLGFKSVTVTFDEKGEGEGGNNGDNGGNGGANGNGVLSSNPVAIDTTFVFDEEEGNDGYIKLTIIGNNAPMYNGMDVNLTASKLSENCELDLCNAAEASRPAYDGNHDYYYYNSTVNFYRSYYLHYTSIAKDTIVANLHCDIWIGTEDMEVANPQAAIQYDMPIRIIFGEKKQEPVAATPTYTVQVAEGQSEWGTVKMTDSEGWDFSSNSEIMKEGDLLTIKALANEGYEFVNWTISGTVAWENGYSATDDIAMLTVGKEDLTFTANFKSLKKDDENNDPEDNGETIVGNNVTYDFTKIAGFDKWTTSYEKHVVEYTTATATFASANHQTATITNCPVTKGGDVVIVMNDGKTISSLTLTCTQWTTKAQTITLNVSKDGGETYTKTNVTSENFVLASELEAGVNAVKFTFSSSSNQIGIKSLNVVLDENVGTGIDNSISTSAMKMILNGQVVIVRDGVQYDVMGRKM